MTFKYVTHTFPFFGNGKRFRKVPKDLTLSDSGHFLLFFTKGPELLLKRKKNHILILVTRPLSVTNKDQDRDGNF